MMENQPNPVVMIDEVLGHLEGVSVEMMSGEPDLNHIAKQLLQIFFAFKNFPGNDILTEPAEMSVELSVGDVPTEIGNGTVKFKLYAECSFELDK